MANQPLKRRLMRNPLRHPFNTNNSAYPTICRNHRIILPNHTEAWRANSPALTGLESTRRLQRSGCSGRSDLFFRPAFLESIPAALAIRRCSFRIAFDADKFWVCAKASPNTFGKSNGQTRGFTSCLHLLIFWQCQSNRTERAMKHDEKKAQQPPFGHVCGIPKRKPGVRRRDAPPPLHRGNQAEHFNRIVTQIEKTILDSAIASLKKSHHSKELGWDTKTSVDRKEPGQPTGERSTGPRGLLRKQSRHFHFESFSQNNQFNIRDTTPLRLNFRERCASQLQSTDRAASGEHFLRQSPLIGQWRWIYVWRLEKASEMEVAAATKGGSLRHFSPRVGKTASFSPAWNCGPTLLRETLFGNKSSSETSKTRAMKSISQSGTRRRCDSKLATESRLMLQPRSWSLVAKAAWDQPLLARHFRTCGPMRFIAGFTPCDGNESPGNGCVHTNTESACNSKGHVVKGI